MRWELEFFSEIPIVILAVTIMKMFSRISSNLKSKLRAFLVVQWLRIHLPMQGTQVQALVREDPTCQAATKPVCHNY